ncbi:DUF1295 hypothetical protein [Helicosporidium sp. ATCC 50920]|nr:DUF1295 hypothetical protein [Helicosporidium sp. ATCC 50920]|eukprot:KDD75041.1 DUF1295 hypothetical protein [Helicosporidium sp. ATCC 50920]
MDKLWSLMPTAFVWHFLYHTELRSVFGERLFDARAVAVALLVTLWGARLTWQFARRGGYSTMAYEDYRWATLRADMASIPGLYPAFNLLVVSIGFPLLLLAIALPAYFAWDRAGSARSWLDWVAGAAALAALTLEARADAEQNAFQARRRARGPPRKRSMGAAATGRSSEAVQGFVQSGLWAWSRHPNYFAEQLFWWALYLFAVAASGRWINWAAAGPLGLSLMFHGSVNLTERIAAKKYARSVGERGQAGEQ